MEEELEKLRSLVETLREEMNAILADREFGQSKDEATRRDRETVRNLEERVRVLEENQNATSDDGDTEDGEEGDDGESVVDDVGVGPDETNEHVTVPDTFELQGLDIPRKSIEYTPERTNAHQLHEFDDAPSVGAVKVIKLGKWWILVDPDGTTGTRKWMIPLRRETTGGIELKWAQFGQDTGSDSDSESDPDPGFVRRRVLTNVFVSGNTLVFETEWHTVIASAPGEPIPIVGSTCEGSD